MSGESVVTEAALAAAAERAEQERQRVRSTDRNSRRSTFHILFYSVTATIIQAAILVGLYERIGPGWVWGLVHAATIAALAAIAWYQKPNGWRSRYLILLAVTTLFLGIFGPLGTMLAMLLHVWFRRNATPFEEWYNSLFPDHSDLPSEKLYEMLTRGLADSAGQDNVTSFTDVLQYGSIEQKRAVISLLTRDFRPEFAPALQSALADSNPAVRVQAATAAASIENDFLERAIELERAAARHPDDPVAQMDVARHFDNYAFSGILDGDRQAENRRKAEMAYRRAIELDPEEADALLGVGRLMIRTGRLEEATKWFERGFTNGVIRPSEMAWYMEAVFRLEDYDRLRYAVAGFGEDLLDDPNTGERLRDVILAWQGPPAREEMTIPAPGGAAETDIAPPPSAPATGAA